MTPGRAPGPDLPARVPRRYAGPSTPPPSDPPKRPFKPDPAWDKLLMLVGAAVAVIALLVVPGIINRGGKNPVADAAEATRNSPGVRMNFAMSAQGPTAMTMTGSGVMNGETNRARLDFRATGAGPAGSGAFEISEVIDDLDLYIHSPQLSSIVGSGKSWMLIRAEGFLGQLFQGDTGGLGAGLSASPTQQLEQLESASDNVAVVGHEQVGGVATTHYTAVIDVEEVADQIADDSGELGDLMRQSLEQLGSNQTVEVWIDDQGLLRRERANMSMGSLGSLTMQIDFSDYGIRPQIDVPSAADTYDVTSSLEQMLESSGS